MSYRDGDAVVREMLAGKRADALSRARSLGYAQRAVLDGGAIAQVEALHDRTMPFLFDEMPSIHEATAAVAKVEELIAAYDALLERSEAALVASPLDVDAAFARPRDWRGTAEGAERLANEMSIDREAVERFAVRSYGVAIASGPWALLVGLDETGSETWIDGRITVAVPAAIPHVAIRRERAGDAMLEDLGLKNEIETGEPTFDDLFWVQGHREAVLAVATPLVRRLLIDLYDHHGVLEVGAGIARVSWSGPWRTLGASGVPKNIVPAILELRAAFCE